MIRARAIKVVLVMVGLLFTAGIYPVTTDLWHRYASDPGDTMMMSLYFTLGIFLLLASRNPSAHRSLIAFAAWSSFAHAVVMSVLAFGPTYVNDRKGFWGGSAVLVAIGVALVALAPAKQPGGQASAASA
jgi:peptidoglycan/LPS O-acetylase OafA/YrhL